MTESESVVRLEKVSKAYTDGQTFYALNEIDVAVNRGERVAIMGPSGSGKSTMLNLICGLDIPTSGRVWVGGIELSQLTDDERTRLRRGHFLLSRTSRCHYVYATAHVAMQKSGHTRCLNAWACTGKRRIGPIRCPAENASA